MEVFRSIPLSSGAYQTLATLVYRHSRIRLGPDKQPMLANRLRRRLSALGLDSFDEYCAQLESGDHAEEIEQMVDLISTNHTHFFREPEHFNFLQHHILPELAPRLAGTGQPLRLWSAASSTGEEPYTLAIVLAEFFRERPTAAWEVDASDISRRVLRHAQQGIYPVEAGEAIPPEVLKRHFQRGVGIRTGVIRVKTELRRRIRFQRINLFQTDYPVPPQHVVFCRNVMIYFDTPSRAVVIEKLIRQLVPGGYLIIGHSESLLGIPHPLETVRQGIYRRP